MIFLALAVGFHVLLKGSVCRDLGVSEMGIPLSVVFIVIKREES